jgi:hypothetical protein
MSTLERRVGQLEAHYGPLEACPECHGAGLVAISGPVIPPEPPGCPTCGHPPRVWRCYPGVDVARV